MGTFLDNLFQYHIVPTLLKNVATVAKPNTMSEQGAFATLMYLLP